MKKIGLAVMRLQPLHDGHKILIKEMVDSCDIAIVVIGSAQESKTQKNPFSYEERRSMVFEAFEGEKKLFVMPINDIGAKTKKEWVEFVEKELAKNNLPLPTHYFSGSVEDAQWYVESEWEIVIVDRFTVGKGISATKIREEMKKAN